MTGEPFPDRFKRWYSVLPPALRVLMTVNTVLYALWLLVTLFGLGFVQRFALGTLAYTPHFPGTLYQPWQVLTYGFLHLQPGIWGFIAYGFNMLWLYWLGRDYEELYGSHRLFAAYVMATLGGALLALLAATVLSPTTLPVAGALAAVLGVVCMIATIDPQRGIGLFIIGVVPMKWVAIGFLFLAILFAAGHWPHVLVYLGAAATGFGFGRAQLSGRDLGAWARPLFRRSSRGYQSAHAGPSGGRMKAWFARRGQRKAAPAHANAPRRAGAAEPLEPAAGGNDVVDRLLDKISEKGYDSLTEEEKRLLYEASRND